MRQLVSLVKDGRVQYALVDEETDELTEFAQILVPEHFDLTASAHLGLNLINAIGLNGRKPTKRKVEAIEMPEPPAIEAPYERAESTYERRLRKQREAYAAKREKAKRGTVDRYPSGRARPDPSNKVGRYLSEEEVLAVIADYPEGIRSIGIAERIWRKTGDGGEMPRWVLRSVENRLSGIKIRARDKGTPLPLVIGSEPRAANVDGTPSKLAPYVLYKPLGGSHDGLS